MPDLNLIDDSGFEDSTVSSAPAPRRAGGGGGGGGMKLVLTLVIVLVVVGGVGFFLWNQGMFPFKKKTQVVAEFHDDEGFDEIYADQQQIMPEEYLDTSAVNLLETPLVEEQPLEATSVPASSDPSMSAASLGQMSGDFTVQVIAFREKSKADDILANLEFAGYPAFVEKVQMKGMDWYTVRIGRYPSRKDAIKAVDTFGAQLKSNYFVDRIRSH